MESEDQAAEHDDNKTPEAIASAASDPMQGVVKRPELEESVHLVVLRDGKLVGPYPGTIVAVTDGSYVVDVRVAEEGEAEWTEYAVDYGKSDASYWEREAKAPA
jgi:hypothetical protein